MSRINSHCLEVSKEGRFFLRGSNDHEQIGLGEEKIRKKRNQILKLNLAGFILTLKML